MKREAEALRTSLRELVDELAETEEHMPANEYLVTNHNNRVVSLRLFLRTAGDDTVRPLNVHVQDACELAAWLVVAAGLGEQMNFEEARAYFDRALKEALES